MLSNKYLAPTFTIRPLLPIVFVGRRGADGSGDGGKILWSVNDQWPPDRLLTYKKWKIKHTSHKTNLEGFHADRNYKGKLCAAPLPKGMKSVRLLLQPPACSKSRYRALNALWRISLHPVQYFTCVQHFSCIYYIINTKSTEVKMSLSREELCIRKWVKNSPLN